MAKKVSSALPVACLLLGTVPQESVGFPSAPMMKNEVSPTTETTPLHYKTAVALDNEEGPGADEFVWFYRAGFEAVHLLQQQERWVPAVNIAEKLATVNGPRSQEARKLANEIRLKHFLWEEK